MNVSSYRVSSLKNLSKLICFGGILLTMLTFFISPRLFVHAAKQDQIQINLTIMGIPPSTDIVLIPSAQLHFSPDKATPMPFGRQNVTLDVTEPRIQGGGTCVFALKPYASNPSEFATYASHLSAVTVPYTNGHCQVTLPSNQQNIPKWDFSIRITDSSTQKVYGADPSYFMLYGALGVVSISGQAIP